MGENHENLKGWRKSKGWRQEDLADKLGEPRPTYQSWETGRTPTIPPEVQAKLRKLGYKGPWPVDESKSAPGGDYVTRAEFDELSADLEDACEVIRFLLRELPAGSRPGVLPRKFRSGS